MQCDGLIFCGGGRTARARCKGSREDRRGARARPSMAFPEASGVWQGTWQRPWQSQLGLTCPSALNADLAVPVRPRAVDAGAWPC